MTVSVLLIGFPDDIRSSLTELFQNEEYLVAEELESGDAVLYIMEHNPGLLVMSENMPSLEGVEFLPLVRRLTRSPIIVVGDGGEAAVVRALLQGADMYLRTPFNYRELLSRVRALMRRAESRPNEDEPQIDDNINLLDQLPPELRPYPLHTQETLLDEVIRKLTRSLREGRFSLDIRGLVSRALFRWKALTHFATILLLT